MALAIEFFIVTEIINSMLKLSINLLILDENYRYKVEVRKNN